jgi:hypothetical protein
MDVEAVREHERLARSEMRRDLLLIQIRLDMIGDQNHDDIGGFGGLGGIGHFETGGFRLGARFAAGIEPDHHIHAGIAQVEGVRVTLAAIADDCDGAAFE